MLFKFLLVFSGITLLPEWVESQWSELYEDFRTCRGRPTGMDEYVQDAIPKIATCLTRSGKWCKATCGLQRFGFINETGYFAAEQGRKEYLRTTKITNPTRDQLFKDLQTCMGNESYAPRGKCKILRNAFYCFYNKYIQKCKIHKPKKDLDVASEEGGLLDDAVDGVGILGGMASSSRRGDVEARRMESMPPDPFPIRGVRPIGEKMAYPSPY